MRADRLLSILLLLQAKGRLTAEELAGRLEVSERTIYRDLDALSAAGVPVYAERGPGGGCALPENYRTNLTGFNEDEVRTLFMAGVSGPLTDLGLGKALEDALLKLSAALPSAHRLDAEHARQRIYLDAAGWNQPAETVPYLNTIQEALWQERRLCLVYRRNDGDCVERLVEPYGLVAKASIWYLVAVPADEEGAEVRVYRVSRVHSVTLTEQRFKRPPNFNLAQFWVESCAQFKSSFPRYSACVRVAPELLPILPQVLGESANNALRQAAPPAADGWQTLTLTFERFEVARSQLMGFGPQVEVLEPAELRQSIIELAASLTTFYSNLQN